uniref:UDENN domain-containing protein n=1 Tax=Syphacia muris TaxID=451379 RepID=A0A0N5A965_9BILA
MSECDYTIFFFISVTLYALMSSIQIEYCYPPLSSDGSVPLAWQNLPTLALPDGAHNVEQDIIYFLLPSLSNPNRAVFGISCCRQMQAEDLINRSNDVTRNTVQKSVCVISTIPLYGVLTAKLELITRAYFNERDFEKVVFFITPAHRLCETMLSLVSLVPRLLEEGLFQAAEYCKVTDLQPGTSTVSECRGSNCERMSDDATAVDCEAVTNAADKVTVADEAEEVEKFFEKTDDSTTAASSDFEITSHFNLETDTYGFPPSIFTKGSLFHPYLSISYLDVIRSVTTRAYCIGVTNALFVQRRNTVDAIITINENDEGVIELVNDDLKKILSLTAADLRFADFIIKRVQLNTSVADWDGSDDWIRLQTRAYLLSLIATAKSNLKDSVTDFNEAFVSDWKLTNNYRIWSSGEYPDLASALPGHIFPGGAGVADVLLKVQHSGIPDGGKRLITAMTSTGKFISERGMKVKSSISSWFQGGSSTTHSEFQ